MAIPFLSLFKKKAKPEPVAPAPVAPIEKKASERLSKTVMPSAPRTAAPQQPAPAMATAPAAMVAPRTVAFGAPSGARPADLPPAVALAIEPAVERTVSIELSDVVQQMPAGLVRSLDEGEGSRRILLKASELERGMANGKPAVSIASVYEQVPEIFTGALAPDESRQVALPFSVVLEQFSSLQTRADQQRLPSLPQVETPFLKVALEDNQRFGTGGEQPEIAELPSVRVEPATAQSIAAAEPEPVAKETLMAMPPPKPEKPFSLRPAPANGAASAPAAPPAAPARIPFKLTPNGTDAPATERVPASNGPSVPTSSPAATGAPTRIPFKITAPSDDIRPKPEPWLTKASLAAEAQAAEAAAKPPEPASEAPAAPMISLPLKPILEALPPMQLARDASDVPDEARIELPVSLVEPQLVTGRVSIAPEQFANALPQEFRALFDASDAALPVSLPLQEVLKNLPSAALRMRDDQEEQEKGANFETPFSTKAAEDAKRFKVAAAPIAKPVVLPAPTPAAVEEEPALKVSEPAKPEPAPAPKAPVVLPSPVVVAAPANGKPGERNALQSALETDEELDAKAVVAHVGKMEGVKACAIMFGDGLSLAGNLPAEYEADGLCAMAPALLQKVGNHMVETKLGSLRAMTLSCAKAAVTFFMHNDLCLAALHAEEELASEIRERLGRAVQELSRQYSHPA